MSANSSNEQNEPHPQDEGGEETTEQQNDERIGQAAQRSVVVILVIAVLVGAGVWLANRDWSKPAGEPPKITPPKQRETVGEAPEIRFTDITRDAGINFVHINGATGKKLMPETMGGGCAFLDYDADGDSDILLVNSMHWPDSEKAKAGQPTLKLYQNDGFGRFKDVTKEAGLDVALYGMGVAVGDYDNDGDSDIFVTALGGNRLFQNTVGKFRDVTEKAGLAGKVNDWSTGTGFFDYDNDGDLDLFVCNYVEWSEAIDKKLNYQLTGVGRAYGPPMNFGGTFNYLYRNDGNGRFTDVSEKANIRKKNVQGKPAGKALGVYFVDVDEDGHIDILIANDTVQNFYFRNKGDGTFEELGVRMGVGYDRNGEATGAMGIDGGLYSNGTQLGIFIGNFAEEMTSVYVSQQQRRMFSDDAMGEGIGAPSRIALTFGLFLFDADLDGRLDLLQANGHLEERINVVDPSQTYKQAAQLFWNRGSDSGVTYAEMEAPKIGDLTKPIVGRGAAFADIDGDGDLDVLLTQIGGAPLLLRNDQKLNHHWLRVKLSGFETNRDAIGAWVEVKAGDLTQRRQIMPTRSYLSQVEKTLTFGLGKRTRIDSVKVFWPSGETQAVPAPNVDITLQVKQERTSFRSIVNTAKAELENGRFIPAIKLLRTALKMNPKSMTATRNLARAMMWSGKPAESVRLIEDATDQDDDSPTNAYLAGIALKRANKHHDALKYLQKAVKLDPHTDAIRFQLGIVHENLKQIDKAVVQFREAVRLNPLHAAAHYQLSRHAGLAGRTDEARRHGMEFERLRRIFGERGRSQLALERCIYTNAESIEDEKGTKPGEAPEVKIKVQFKHHGEVRDQANKAIQLTSSTVVAMDDAGKYTFFGVDPQAKLSLFDFAADGSANVKPIELDISYVGKPRQCVAGNFGDVVTQVNGVDVEPRLADILVVGDKGVALLRQKTPGLFEDVTFNTGIAAVDVQHAIWSDPDHDGDLDLVFATGRGVEVWQNNGDGSFKQVAEDLGIKSATPGVGIAAVDLDGVNESVDLIFTHADKPTIVFENQRAGRFRRMAEPPGPLEPANQVLADDVNNDGFPDILLVNESRVLIRFGRRAKRQTLTATGFKFKHITFIDYDNDGWMDLCAVGTDDRGSGAIRLWRNGGMQPWKDVSAVLGIQDLKLPGVESVSAADVDTDGDTDLLLQITGGKVHRIINEGGHAHQQLKLSMISLTGIRSSAGTRVEIRDRDFRATRWTQRELPVEIGLADRTHLDSVQTLWLNGVIDNQIHVRSERKPMGIVIVKFADTGSCPFLYVWDGKKYRFVTDLVGTAATNLAFARTMRGPVNPHELVVIGDDLTFARKDGVYEVKVTSELREITYFDHLKLIAVDHPADQEIHSTDRLIMPPFFKSEPWALGGLIPLTSAIGDDGVDRTQALVKLDGIYGKGGKTLPAPIQGVTAPLVVDLKFASIPKDKPLVIALTGWFLFGSSSSNIALSQRTDIPMIWPELEAMGADGKWVKVKARVGVPTGKTKTIICDLSGKLPDGCVKLRLRTSFAIRWDRIALFEKRTLSAENIHTLPMQSAQLAWRGQSELKVRQKGRATAPDFHRLVHRPAWLTAVQGWCTRYGDVKSLLTQPEGKIAILNCGDAMTVKFDPQNLPQLKPGMKRTWMFYTVGWVKEGDPNSFDPYTVGPLPTEDMQPLPSKVNEHTQDWRLKYNRRWVPGNRFFSN